MLVLILWQDRHLGWMERSINGEDIKLRLELIILFAAKAVPALSARHLAQKKPGCDMSPASRLSAAPAARSGMQLRAPKPAAHDMASPGATP